jgi:hypothetical protein
VICHGQRVQVDLGDEAGGSDHCRPPAGGFDRQRRRSNRDDTGGHVRGQLGGAGEPAEEDGPNRSVDPRHPEANGPDRLRSGQEEDDAAADGRGSEQRLVQRQ